MQAEDDDLLARARKLLAQSVIDAMAVRRDGPRTAGHRAPCTGQLGSFGRRSRFGGPQRGGSDDLPESEAALRLAVRFARAAGSTELEAEARIAHSGTLATRGQLNRAIVEIKRAVANSTGFAAATARVQEAVLLQLAGREDESLTTLRLALRVLQRSDDNDWRTRALSNRSIIYTRRRQFRLAEADLRVAARLAEENGLTFWAAHVQHNWGWLDSSRGHVLAALEHYEDAERRYAELGTEVGSLAEARARLLLSIRDAHRSEIGG